MKTLRTAVSAANRCNSAMNETGAKGDIILAAPRGFCAGVRRALEIVETALSELPCPIYVFHEIVHNDHVVSELRSRGVKFVESLNEVPEGATVIFSAHGVSPDIESEAKQRKLHTIDATCPLVKKIHAKAEKFQQDGGTVLLIGHRGHPEITGTLGRSGADAQVVENIDEAAKLSSQIADKKAIWLSQTTLCNDDIAPIVAVLEKRFPGITGGGGICYATANRQNAVRQLCRECSFILIIGSPKSSNSNRLLELALNNGVTAQLINDASEINFDSLPAGGNIGITAGASAPEILVTKTIERLRNAGWTKVRELAVADEKKRFRK